MPCRNLDNKKSKRKKVLRAVPNDEVTTRQGKEVSTSSPKMPSLSLVCSHQDITNFVNKRYKEEQDLA